MRVRDVEAAAGTLDGFDEDERQAAAERVRRVVRCEKKTERIQGGDNGDEEGVLR